MNIIQTRLSMIFNEWVRRYADNPDEFSELLDERGSPFEDYGANCAAYFTKLANELDAQNKLPKNI